MVILFGRISYGKDILFMVESVLKTNKGEIAILKGITYRIIVDAPIDDLEKIDSKEVKRAVKESEAIIENKIERLKKRSKEVFYTGKILHLDGDKNYSRKSVKYYKNLGLNATVKNITESKQSFYVRNLLDKYKPDILVITGHDAMLKNGRDFYNIYNYRNSRYFVKTVKEARKWNKSSDKLVIFAGACQSYFEAIMAEGANFASSPARILIDFIDPLILASTIAKTNENRYIYIDEIAKDLMGGLKSIGGTRARGKKRSMII